MRELTLLYVMGLVRRLSTVRVINHKRQEKQHLLRKKKTRFGDIYTVLHQLLLYVLWKNLRDEGTDVMLIGEHVFVFLLFLSSSSKAPVKLKAQGPNLVRHDILCGPVYFIDKLQHDFICTGSQPYLPAEKKKACWWWLPLVLAVKLLT